MFNRCFSRVCCHAVYYCWRHTKFFIGFSEIVFTFFFYSYYYIFFSFFFCLFPSNEKCSRSMENYARCFLLYGLNLADWIASNEIKWKFITFTKPLCHFFFSFYFFFFFCVSYFFFFCRIKNKTFIFFFRLRLFTIFT